MKIQQAKDRQTKEAAVGAEATRKRLAEIKTETKDDLDDNDNVDTSAKKQNSQKDQDEDNDSEEEGDNDDDDEYDGVDPETDETRKQRDLEFAKQGIKIVRIVSGRGKVHEMFDMTEIKVDPNWNGQARQQMAEALMDKHGLLRDGWTFVYSKKATKRAGACIYDKRQISITWEYAKRAFEKDFINTILHEIAHKLYNDQLRLHPEWKKYDRAGKEINQSHGENWKRIAINIGCDGSRCHHYKFTKQALKPWIRYCPNGHFSYESTKRMIPGRNSLCKTCKTATLEKPNPEYLALNPDAKILSAPVKQARYLRTCPCGQYKKYTNTKMKPTQRKFRCKECKGQVFEKDNR